MGKEETLHNSRHPFLYQVKTWHITTCRVFFYHNSYVVVKSSWDPKISRHFSVVDVLPAYTNVVWLAHALFGKLFHRHTSSCLILKKNSSEVPINIILILLTRTYRLSSIICSCSLKSILVPLTISPISIALYSGHNVQKQPCISYTTDRKIKAYRSQEANQCFFLWGRE